MKYLALIAAIFTGEYFLKDHMEQKLEAERQAAEAADAQEQNHVSHGQTER